MNLLNETIADIKNSGHEISDIIFIGSESSGHSYLWDEFTCLANHEYSCGFGAQKVASDLVIVFDDKSKMWRHEYDGSEKWAYSTPFEEPKEKTVIKQLFANSLGWETLSEMNQQRVCCVFYLP